MKRHQREYRGTTVTWVEDHATEQKQPWYPYTFLFHYPDGTQAHRTFHLLHGEVLAWCREQFGPENFGEETERTWWYSGACFRIEGEDRALAFKLRWL